MGKYPVKKDDISIVLCGEAGQGIQTVEFLLTRFLKQCGYNFYATKEYMSRIRGGSNSTEIRVSSQQVCAYVDHIDILFPLTREALQHVSKRVSPETIILGECEKLKCDSGIVDEIIDIPFSQYALELGGAIYANIIAVGVISGLLGLELETIEDYLKSYFARKTQDVIENNVKALEKGFGIGKNLIDSGTISIAIRKNKEIGGDIVLNGAEAVGMGALCGGCNFIASYPMSPSTGVLVFLAEQSKEFDIIAEQAEDEIGAVNMAVGASYAGARSMATTSGGGFALMEEGVSLSGMLEAPVVIHIAQRPGPATGLPTRTEQGDLELALYSGHGEFPRIIYTPGSIEDAFYLTQRAFNSADKFQIPVFILTDQYLIDSYYNTRCFDVSKLPVQTYYIETVPEYKRYASTADGISPRGIPGFGSGFVVVDSDEHDQEGHITENLDIRTEMVDKRLKKLELIQKDAIPPELIGNKECKTLVVCWGSTYKIVLEAIRKLGRNDVSLLYFRQVYPLHQDTASYFERAEKRVIIENNATCQFAKVLKLYADINISLRILKYNGLQFSVEEIVTALHRFVG